MEALDLEPGVPKINADRRLIVRLAPTHLARDFAHETVELGVHVRNLHDAEHSPGLIDAGRQLVGLVGNAGSFGSIEELFRWHVEGLPVVV
jgi:hypothetical protein